MSRKKDLDNLVAAFGNHLREEHPNIERVKCPGRAALISLAEEPEAVGSEAALAHIRECAACLNELKELRVSSKRPQQRISENPNSKGRC